MYFSTILELLGVINNGIDGEESQKGEVDGLGTIDGSSVHHFLYSL